MKVLKLLFLFIALTNTVNLLASCSGPNFTITELLNHDPQNHHIFTCTILATYKSKSGYESIAVVNKRFIGSPTDTIYLFTGGKTTAGGQNLYQNSEWLIFSPTQDSLHYTATVCDYLSSKIKKGNIASCEPGVDPMSEIYVNILEQYESIRKESYSGIKDIIVDNKLIAKGYFTSGIPSGDWLHFSGLDNYKHNIKRSKISYKDGMLHGQYNLYYEERDNNILIRESLYNNDLPVLINNFQSATKYEYKNEKESKILVRSIDSLGNIIKQIPQIVVDYKSNRYEKVGYRHGYYFNKVSRDSSSYTPLAEGNYFRGAKIGKWIYFNKKGRIIDTAVYPEINPNPIEFVVYDDLGNLKVQGLNDAEKRIGIWKYYYDKELTYEEAYDSNGDLISKTRYYSSGGFEHTSYLNNKIHGQRIVYGLDNSIKSIENYAYGKLNGTSTFFYADGAIQKESEYINSREFSVKEDTIKNHIKNGFENGYFIQRNIKNGEKLNEGLLWNGFRTSVWISHKRDGTYTKSHYPTDKQELMNPCSSPLSLIETYNKDGELIHSLNLRN